MQTARGPSSQLSARTSGDGGVRMLLPAPPAIRSQPARLPFSSARHRHLAPGAVRRFPLLVPLLASASVGSRIHVTEDHRAACPRFSKRRTETGLTTTPLSSRRHRVIMPRRQPRSDADAGAGGPAAMAAPQHAARCAGGAVAAVCGRRGAGAACRGGQRDVEGRRLPRVLAEPAGRLLRRLGRRPGGERRPCLALRLLV